MSNVVTFPARQPSAAGATLTPACPVLAPEIREHIERAIEAALETAQRLIGILDRADGNPDLEDGADDEPSSAPRRVTPRRSCGCAVATATSRPSAECLS